MKHLRNLLWLLFHPGSWKIYRETKIFVNDDMNDIVNFIKREKEKP